MASTSIGSLRYDVIADTVEFEKGINATKKELKQAEKAFRDSMTDAEKYGNELARLENLYEKGLIDQKAYEASLEKLRKEFAKTHPEVKKTETNLSKVKKWATGAAAGAGVWGAVRAFRDLAGEVEELTQQVLEAERAGLGLAEYRAWGMLAKQAGTNVDQLSDAMLELGNRVADAETGTASYVDALKMLGFTAEDLIDLPMQERFEKVARALAGVENEARKVFIAEELMGEAGRNLLLAFDDIGNLEAFRAEAERVVGALDEQKLKEATASIRGMNNEVEALKNQMAALATELGVFEAVGDAAAGASDIVGGGAEGAEGQGTPWWASGIAGAIGLGFAALRFRGRRKREEEEAMAAAKEYEKQIEDINRELERRSQMTEQEKLNENLEEQLQELYDLEKKLSEERAKGNKEEAEAISFWINEQKKQIEGLKRAGAEQEKIEDGIFGSALDKLGDMLKGSADALEEAPEKGMKAILDDYMKRMNQTGRDQLEQAKREQEEAKRAEEEAKRKQEQEQQEQMRAAEALAASSRPGFGSGSVEEYRFLVAEQKAQQAREEQKRILERQEREQKNQGKQDKQRNNILEEILRGFEENRVRAVQ